MTIPTMAEILWRLGLVDTELPDLPDDEDDEGLFDDYDWYGRDDDD